MNKLTKKQLLIGALILLFAVNLGALGTIIYQNYRYQQERSEVGSSPGHYSTTPETTRDPGRPMRQMEPGNRQGTPRMFTHFIQRRLNLDQDQLRQYESMMQETRAEQHKIVSRMDMIRDSMMQELTRENPDTSKLNELANEIGQLHGCLKHNTIDHFQRLRSICRPDQRSALNEMILRMSTHDRRNPSRRRPQGHRRMNREIP
jgi:Spy/CpxP family protein refolding chaperone